MRHTATSNPTTNPSPAGPAVADAAAGLVLADQALDTTDDFPYWRPHSDLDHAEDPCRGALRWDDQDGDVWSYFCDTCHGRWGIARVAVDEHARTSRLLDLALLPEAFLDKPLEPHAANRDALDACRNLLAHWGDPDRPRPPMLCGSNGLGKTHLLVRTGRRLIEQRGVHLRYCTFADLLDEAKLAMDRKDESSQAVFDQAAKVPLLILDDLGAGMNSDWTFNVLEGLVDRRYRARLPLMGATNVPPGQWRDAFGPRAGSRLMELCAPVEVTGTDWRTR